MKIEIRSTTLPCPLEKKEMRFLGQVLNHAAAEEGVPDFARVTLLLTDNENIQRFNSRFRHIEQPTDVLSFPMFEERAWQEMPLLPGLPAPSLGDIIISLPRCEEQAEAYGHSFQRELCFLALHGFLHLLGYDHMEEAEAAVMEARAKTYLHAMGVER